MRVTALAAGLCVLAVTATSALAAALTIKTTPTRPKSGQTVEMLIRGLKPGERVRAREVIADGEQTRTIYPRRRANASGVLLVAVRAQVRGKHTWTFRGRQSRRTGRTVYIVR